MINVFQLLLTKSETMYLENHITIASAMDRLNASGYTAVPVIREDGTYAGTVSEGDFLRAFLDGKDEDAAGQAMPLQTIVRTDRNPAVKIDVDLARLFSEALNQNFVPVVDDRNMFIGIVTRKQVISFFMKHFDQIMENN